MHHLIFRMTWNSRGREIPTANSAGGGYKASEGIDWVWEHRIDDLALFDI